MPPLQRLERLHASLCLDQSAARAAIDAHLLACYISAGAPDPVLVLPRACTYHYHNLPDLTRFLRKGLTTGEWSSDLVRSFMAVYCLQLKKIKRTYKSATLYERSALMNLLHGLLLGLYPYNTRHGTFEERVRIAGSVRALMTGPNALAFIESHESLFQFAMIEYLSNVVPDFCPVEEEILVRHSQYRFNVNQVCENFRAAAFPVVASATMWDDLNGVAASLLHSLYRQLKVSNLKLVRRYMSPRTNLSLVNVLAQDQLFERIMQLPYMPVTTINMIAQIKLLCPDLTFQQLQAVEYFWESVFFSLLPANVVAMQRARLDEQGSCELHQRAVQCVYVCLPCAMRSKGSVLGQKFAYDCIERRLHCAACSRAVVPIQLLGRVMTIRDVGYYLCTGCLRPTVWQGDLARCAACEPRPERSCMTTCVACNRKAVEVIHKVLDLDALRIVYTPLCYNHAKASVLSHSTVYDVKSLMLELAGP